MHIAIVVHAIASVEKVFRTIGSLLLFKTGEIDRGHQCGIDHSLYLDLKIEIVDCAVRNGVRAKLMGCVFTAPGSPIRAM